MAVGKYAAIEKQKKDINRRIDTKENNKVAKYANKNEYSREDIDDFAREWEEACNLYREGIKQWSRKWSKEWTDTCRMLKSIKK